MADMYAVSGETLTGIAGAIRSKTGSDDFMTVASMASAIEGISGGFGKVSSGIIDNPQQSTTLQLTIGKYDNFLVLNVGTHWTGYGYRVVNGFLCHSNNDAVRVFYTNLAGTSIQLAFGDYKHLIDYVDGILTLKYSAGLGYYAPTKYSWIAWND